MESLANVITKQGLHPSRSLIGSKTKNCEQHGEYRSVIRQLADKVHESGCPVCVEERQAREEKERAECDAQARKDRILRQLFQQAAIPERFTGRTFENYRVDPQNRAQVLAFKIAKGYADRFEDRLQHGGGLVMCGKPGNGKTHLAVAIANQVIQARRSAIFMNVYKAIRNIRSTWRKDSEKTEQQAIDDLCKPDLLILDEIGVQYGSDSEKIIMFDILNTRYENMRPTILLSNLSKDELTAVLGERVIDRMQEGGGAVIPFDWESYRSKVHKDERLPVPEIKPSPYL